MEVNRTRLASMVACLTCALVGLVRSGTANAETGKRNAALRQAAGASPQAAAPARAGASGSADRHAGFNPFDDDYANPFGDTGGGPLDVGAGVQNWNRVERRRVPGDVPGVPETPFDPFGTGLGIALIIDGFSDPTIDTPTVVPEIPNELTISDLLRDLSGRRSGKRRSSLGGASGATRRGLHASHVQRSSLAGQPSPSSSTAGSIPFAPRASRQSVGRLAFTRGATPTPARRLGR
jgi:hypothetical protein